jgi:hypothetical protein
VTGEHPLADTLHDLNAAIAETVGHMLALPYEHATDDATLANADTHSVGYLLGAATNDLADPLMLRLMLTNAEIIRQARKAATDRLDAARKSAKLDAQPPAKIGQPTDECPLPDCTNASGTGHPAHVGDPQCDYAITDENGIDRPCGCRVCPDCRGYGTVSYWGRDHRCHTCLGDGTA